MQNKILLFLSLFILVGFSGQAQEIISYDADEWHRKENREEIARIYNGEVDQAIENMQNLLRSEHLNDPELYFGLSLAWSVKKDLANSLENFRLALDNGLPWATIFTATITQCRRLTDFAIIKGNHDLNFNA